MRAALASTPVKTFQSNKAKITYISSFKKRNKVKPYVKFDLDWQDILRANNQEKRLSEAAVILSGRLAYELHKNNERPVFLTSHWFEKVTRKKRHQNQRLRGQIDHIFNFKFHPRKFRDGEILFNVYEVYYTLESQKILNLEDIIIAENIDAKPQEYKLKSCSVNAPTVEHKSNNYIVDKEIERDIPTGYLSISDNEKLKIKSFEEVQNKPCANGSLNEPAQENLQESMENQAQSTKSVSTEQDFDNDRKKAKIVAFPRVISAKEEKEQYASRRMGNRDEEAGKVFRSLMAKVFDINANTEQPTQTEYPAEQAEQLEPPKEQEQPEKLAQTVQTVQTVQIAQLRPLMQLTTQPETPEYPAEQPEREEEPDMNLQINQTNVNTNDCQMALNKAIFTSFNPNQAREINDHCKFILVEPNKLQVKLENNFNLTEGTKETLRACIRSAYGESIKICTFKAPVVAEQVRNDIVQTTSAINSQWSKFKASFVELHINSATALLIVKNWYDRLILNPESTDDRLILSGSVFTIDRIDQAYGAMTARAAAANNLTIELRYENDKHRPIIFSNQKFTQGAN